MYIAKEQNRWDEYLSQIMMAYRSSKQSSTGQTPNMLMLGREVTLPLQVVIESPKEILKTPDVNEYVQEMQTRMNLAHEIARKTLKRKTEYQKRYYDTKSRKRFFTIRQPVWLHDPTTRRGVCHKLSPNWKGPYIITKKINDLLYLVKKSPKQTPKACHIDRLLPYRGQNFPKWFKSNNK
jgi:hypothetical protein